MKICVMGNSHTGSLKRAWDKIDSDYPGAQIVFFAQRGGGIMNLCAENGKLVPANKSLKKAIEFTSGGLDHITPEDYDLLLLYGLGGNAYFGKGQTHFSRQVKELALKDWSESNASLKMVRLLRKLTGQKVYVGHTPLPAAQGVNPMTEPKDYLDCVHYLNEACYNPLNAELIAQPTETIANGNRTHPDFTKGSKRLSIGDRWDDEAHSSSDIGHMNDEFGEIWLRAFLNKALSISQIIPPSHLFSRLAVFIGK